MVYTNQTDAKKGAAIKAFLNFIYGTGTSRRPGAGRHRSTTRPLSKDVLTQAKAQVNKIVVPGDVTISVCSRRGGHSPCPPRTASELSSSPRRPMAVSAPPRPDPPSPAPSEGLSRGGRPPGRVTDHLFRWLALAAGLLVLVILALIVYSTLDNAWPWFQKEGLGVFADNWDPAHGQFGAGAMIYGTFLVGLIALVIAVPVSVGIALFVTEVSPRAGCGGPSCTPSTSSPRSRRSSTGCGRSSCCVEPLADIYADISSATGDIPVLKTLFARPEHDRAELHDRGNHRRDHDHADHHVTHARGVRDDTRCRSRKLRTASARRGGR